MGFHQDKLSGPYGNIGPSKIAVFWVYKGYLQSPFMHPKRARQHTFKVCHAHKAIFLAYTLKYVIVSQSNDNFLQNWNQTAI